MPVEKYSSIEDTSCLICSKYNGQIQNILKTNVDGKPIVEILKRVLNLSDDIVSGFICVNCVQQLKTVENKTNELVNLFNNGCKIRNKRVLCTPTKNSPDNKREHQYPYNHLVSLSSTLSASKSCGSIVPGVKRSLLTGENELQVKSRESTSVGEIQAEKDEQEKGNYTFALRCNIITNAWSK